MFEPLTLRDALDRLLADLPQRRYCVAFSGGIDSTVLLHALAQLGVAAPQGAVRAIHVNHHLHPQADAWAARAREIATGLQVPLTVLDAHIAPAKGESLEAVARQQRYDLLQRALLPGEILLTAHHRDDQLETFLLQLVRGAGVPGLAAMPGRAPFASGWHVRPLLEATRAALFDYARRNGLEWVEDTSNLDVRFDRNFLRHSVLPALREHWPAIATSVARSAAHMAEARELLDEIARQDLAGARDGSTLQCAALRSLSPAHARNLVRYWLREQGFSAPSAARLEQVVNGVLHARVDAMPAVRWPLAEVRRYRDRLYVMAPLPPAPRNPIAWDWKGNPSVGLGEGAGTLRITNEPGVGLRLGGLPCPLRIEWRSSDAKLKPDEGRPGRTLRYLFQEAGIVPWMRARIPLLISGERLISVGDLYADAQFRAAEGEGGRGRTGGSGPRESVGLQWLDHPAIH